MVPVVCGEISVLTALPRLKHLILDSRRRLIDKKNSDATDPHSPLQIAWRPINGISSSQFRTFQGYTRQTATDIYTTIRLKAASRTWFQTYLRMNPELTVHTIYDSTIPDSLRMKATRLRLSSHRLKVETGRWTRPITPQEQRLRNCSEAIQDEEHVLFRCILSDHIRVKHSLAVTDLPGLFDMDCDVQRCVNMFLTF